MTPNFAHADGPLPLGRVGPRSVSLGELVRRVQDYTKKWPEPTRYPRNAEVCATDMFEATGAKSTSPTATAAIEEFPDY